MAVTIQRNLAQHAGGGTTPIAAQLRVICDAITQCPSKISFAAQAPKPEPLEVRVVNMPAPATEPTQVQVMAMPKRLTTSRVDRDSNGNIVSASNIEEDVAA